MCNFPLFYYDLNDNFLNIIIKKFRYNNLKELILLNGLGEKPIGEIILGNTYPTTFSIICDNNNKYFYHNITISDLHSSTIHTLYTIQDFIDIHSKYTDKNRIIGKVWFIINQKLI